MVLIFFKDISSILAREVKGIIIVVGGGVQNCVLNLNLDKLPLVHGPPSKNSKAVKYMLEELGLVDSWRAKNPKTRDFTFLSGVHGSYSRINMICI